MMKKYFRPFFKIAMLVFCLFCSIHMSAQEKERLWSVIGFSVENEFLTFRGNVTDKNYTNGFQVKFDQLQRNRKSFPSVLLIDVGEELPNVSHWTLTQVMFTPSDISQKAIQVTDRPYAGALYVTKGLTSFCHFFSIHSEISIGLIGPHSFAKQTHIWLNKKMGHQKPQGWDNQVKSDLIINYNVAAKVQVIGTNHFLGNVQLSTRAGTLFTDLDLQLEFKAGKLRPYVYEDEFALKQYDSKKTTEVYFFSRCQVKHVWDNSLLEGGFLQANKNGGDVDFHHIAHSDLRNLVAICEGGIVLDKSKWKLSLSQTLVTKEFKTADAHLYGRVNIAVAL
jgi:hypothetical protein